MKNLILLLIVITFIKHAEAQVSFGVFADCQYCDCETMNNQIHIKGFGREETRKLSIE
jgi:hypothetical protein